jgi:organic hydroperoxide reductase OsmC/OhrA
MPEHPQDVLYTAAAVMEGGREGHWTGALIWICLSQGRWQAAGARHQTPEELFAVGLALAAFLRVGWPIGIVCTDIV